MKEAWKTIEEYSNYEVCNIGGKVRHKKNMRILKSFFANRYGNKQIVCLSSKIKGKKIFYVGKLVAETFIGKCPPDHFVFYKDGNPTNFNADNLCFKSKEKFKRQYHRNNYRGRNNIVYKSNSFIGDDYVPSGERMLREVMAL